MTTPNTSNLPPFRKIGAVSSTESHSGSSLPESPEIAQNRAIAPVLALALTIPVKPKPKGRPRFARSGHAFTPKATREYEQLLAWHMRFAVGKPLGGNLAVLLIFVTRSRADVDNLAKAVLDAGNGVLFVDDRQIKTLEIHKIDGADEEIQIRIYEMEG